LSYKCIYISLHSSVCCMFHSSHSLDLITR
jgi:hypothetical protein